MEEDDEEEEEDDDGDLSKYDLSGWGDESNENPEEKKVSPVNDVPAKTENGSKSSVVRQSEKYQVFSTIFTMKFPSSTQYLQIPVSLSIQVVFFTRSFRF